MATVADVLSIAEGEIGSTNGAKYFNELGEADLGAWCVAYVRWVMWKAGAEFPWHQWWAWDWADPVANIAPRDLRPGDALSFDWGTDGKGDHVGIVKSVHDWGCVTIEGNTSYGVCKEQQRVWANIICGIRPTLDGGAGRWVGGHERWWYRHSDGSYTKDGWEDIDGERYRFDHDGWMQAGWVKDGGRWYYLNTEHDGTYGRMLHSEFREVDGRWYGFGKDGAMLEGPIATNAVHDGTFGAVVFR